MMQFGDQPDIEDNLPKPEDQQQPPQPQYQQPPTPEPTAQQPLPPGWSPAELAAQGQAQTTKYQAQAVANQAGSGGLTGGLNWLQGQVNQVPLVAPVAPFDIASRALGGPSLAPDITAPINLASNALIGRDIVSSLATIGDAQQAANIPSQQLSNIPGFQSQPQYLQQFEQGAVSAAPYVLGGPESLPFKAASIIGGGLGSVADQNLGTQVGPLGIGQIVGMGLPGLLEGGFSRPVSDPMAPQPEPAPAPITSDQPIPATAPVATTAAAPTETPATSAPQPESTAGQPGPSSQEFKDAITRARVAGDFSGLEALAPTYTPEEVRSYFAGYDLASRPGSDYGRPQYGPESVGNGPQDNPLSNAHWQGVFDAQAEKAASGQPLPGQPNGQPPLNEAGQINAGLYTRPPEQIAANDAASNEAFGSLRSASPEAQAFQQSPAGQQFNGQRATGAQAGEASAPIDNNRGGLPTGNQGGIDWNPIHNVMSAVGAPTQPLLTGLHLARFAPQELLRPQVLGNGIRAMGEAFLKGKAPDVIDHVNNGIAPNIPDGFRASDMKAASGTPQLNPTAVQWMINHSPVIGPILDRFRAVNSALLGVMRDAHYNYAADRLARTVPDASPAMYNDLWREANNATGHSTIPGLRGNSVIGNMGLGPSAMAARVQELGNTVIGSGAPVPGLAAGSRAEAFKTLMGVAGTMAGTTALASALGAKVNTDDPLGRYGVNTDFLKPVTTNGIFKTVYGTGGAGYDTVVRGAANIGLDLFNNDLAKAGTDALKFARGEFGVVPSGVIDSILGTTWDNKPYSWNDFLNEAKTGFMADQHGELGQGRSVPIPAQDELDAVKAYGPEGALRALPSAIASSVTTSPINTTSQAFKYATGPDTLSKAFPDSPTLQKALDGKDWTDLLSTEKSSLTKTLDPQVLQQIHDESAQRYPATTQHSDTVDSLVAKKTALEDRILDHYNAGELDKAHTVDAMKVVQKDYYTAKDVADKNPAYQAEQTQFKSSGQTNIAQQALDGYYQVPADKRAEYIRNIGARDPELGVRLANAVQPRNQSKLETMYAAGELR